MALNVLTHMGKAGIDAITGQFTVRIQTGNRSSSINDE